MRNFLSKQQRQVRLFNKKRDTTSNKTGCKNRTRKKKTKGSVNRSGGVGKTNSSNGAGFEMNTESKKGQEIRRKEEEEEGADDDEWYYKAPPRYTHLVSLSAITGCLFHLSTTAAQHTVTVGFTIALQLKLMPCHCVRHQGIYSRSC